MSIARSSADGGSESLASRYGSPLAAYAHDVRGIAGVVRTWAARHLPGVYGPGDMRAVYRWTLAALLGTAVLALLARFLLVGLFVLHVSTDLVLVAGFNLAVSALGAGWLAGDRLRARLDRGRRGLRRLVPGLGPPRL